MADIRTMAQSWVKLLAKNQGIIDQVKSSSKIPGLADMLRRNGLIQTLLFLESKVEDQEKKGKKEGNTDSAIAKLVKMLAGHELGKTKVTELTIESLSQCSFSEYLLYEETAIEGAVWLARWVNAKKSDEGQSDAADAG